MPWQRRAGKRRQNRTGQARPGHRGRAPGFAAMAPLFAWALSPRLILPSPALGVPSPLPRCLLPLGLVISRQHPSNRSLLEVATRESSPFPGAPVGADLCPPPPCSVRVHVPHSCTTATHTHTHTKHSLADQRPLIATRLRPCLATPPTQPVQSVAASLPASLPTCSIAAPLLLLPLLPLRSRNGYARRPSIQLMTGGWLVQHRHKQHLVLLV